MTLSRLPILIVVASLGLTACEKKDAGTVAPTDVSAEPTPAAEPSTETPAADEPELAPILVGFHDVMSPLWHAEAGEKRTADTCEAATDLASGAKGIATAEAPAEALDAEAWQASAEALLSSADALRVVCDEGDPAAFDAAFGAMHTAFHTLVELTKSE